MERVNSKHGPAIDDELKEEQEAVRSDRGLGQTACHRSGWGVAEELDADVRARDREPAGSNLSHAEADERSELAKHLRPSVFPTDKRTLLDCAREMRAPGRVMQRLRSLPADELFVNVEAVWEASGGHGEGARRVG